MIFMFCLSFDAHKETACMKAEFGYVSAHYLTLQSRNLDVHRDHLS